MLWSCRWPLEIRFPQNLCLPSFPPLHSHHFLARSWIRKRSTSRKPNRLKMNPHQPSGVLQVSLPSSFIEGLGPLRTLIPQIFVEKVLYSFIEGLGPLRTLIPQIFVEKVLYSRHGSEHGQYTCPNFHLFPPLLNSSYLLFEVHFPVVYMVGEGGGRR